MRRLAKKILSPVRRVLIPLICAMVLYNPQPASADESENRFFVSGGLEGVSASADPKTPIFGVKLNGSIGYDSPYIRNEITLSLVTSNRTYEDPMPVHGTLQADLVTSLLIPIEDYGTWSAKLRFGVGGRIPNLLDFPYPKICPLARMGVDVPINDRTEISVDVSLTNSIPTGISRGNVFGVETGFRLKHSF